MGTSRTYFARRAPRQHQPSAQNRQHRRRSLWLVRCECSATFAPHAERASQACCAKRNDTRSRSYSGMTDAFTRAVPLLERDVVATLGEGYRQTVRDAAAFIIANELPRHVGDSLVQRVQQDFHDSFIDTTWPACPRHGRHPLWYNEDGWWWCGKDRVAVCRLGDLSTLPRSSE